MTTPGDIDCFVVASDAEYRIARRCLPSSRIVRTGIGARGFQSDQIPACRMVLVTGFAGALDKALKTGDAVTYSACIDETGSSLSCFPLTFGTVTLGLNVSRVVIDSMEKRKLAERYGAGAVDMESYAILEACQQREIRASVLRVISDEADEDLPDFNAAIRDDGSIDARELPRLLLARPIPALRFARSIRTSTFALEKALKRFASSR